MTGGRWRRWRQLPARLPLRVVIPLGLVVLAAVLGLWSLQQNIRQSAAEVREHGREQLVQRLTLLQGTLEYLLRRGDIEQVRAEIAALGADVAVQAALLVDDRGRVLGSLRRADINQDATAVMPMPAWGSDRRRLTLERVRDRLAGEVHNSPDGSALSGFYPVHLGSERGALRPDRIGIVFVKQDLRYRLADARRTEERQTAQFVAVTAVAALLLWVLLHFAVARRAGQLVAVAGALAAGDRHTRTGLAGRNEFAVIGQALDRMADQITDRERRLLESEQQRRLALAAARMGTWRRDLRSGAMTWSEPVEALFGLAPGSFDGGYPSYIGLIHPDDAGHVAAAMSAAIDGTETGFEAEYRVRRPDGSLHWLASRGEVLRDEQGEAHTMTGVVWDVTGRKQADEALHEAKERAEVTLQSIGDGVITTDADGRIDYINPIAERLTGWPVGEARGRVLTDVFRVVNEQSREPVDNPVQRCLRDGAIIGLANHTVLIARDGREIAIEDSAAPIRDRDGRVIGVVLVFHDVSQSRELANQLSWQASHDALTGLVNRREFEQRLGRALATAHGGGQHALLYLDLDQFKLVNDTCGHSAGDELLRQLAALMQARMRTTDTIARLGGDEFGVLLEHCPPEQAERIADTLRTATEGFRFHWDRHSFEVSTSIGVVGLHAGSADLSGVLAAADMACYAAKESGRNRVHVYRESDAELIQRHSEMLWVTRLKAALAEDRFVLYRQSIVPTNGSRDGRLWEVLLRLRGEDGLLVAPGAFLPAAERYNLMPAIDRWVVGTLFARHGQYLRTPSHPQARHIEHISINLSGATLTDDGFLDFVREQLARHAIVPSRLCFEITETAAIAHLGKALALIEGLRALGCRFALDDFGAGLSSFGYLKNLPVDFLKIDGTLVQHIANQPVDYAMVEAIQGIGHVMGVRTIAEFVENDAIREHLTWIGVDYLQGYAIDRPAPID